MEDSLRRVEKLLALLVVQGLEERSIGEKAAALSGAGLANAEIAQLLGTSGGNIAQQLYKERTAAKRKSKRRAKSATK